jgi:hypothetical protein
MSGTSAGPACAWAVLGAWRGSKALFGQLIRQTAGTPDGKVVGAFETDGYQEPFDSADAFEDVSQEMLSRFTAIRISAGAPGETHVSLHLQKRQFPRARWNDRSVPFPRSGAVVTVTDASPKAARETRDRLVGALRQGNLGRWPAPSTGEGDCATAPRAALLRRGKWSDAGDIAATLLFLPFLAVLLVSVYVRRGPCADDPAKTCTAEGLDVPTGSGLLVPVLIGIAIAVVAAVARYHRPALNPALWILPPVEISDKSKARAALRLLYGVVIGVVPIASIIAWVAIHVFG